MSKQRTNPCKLIKIEELHIICNVSYVTGGFLTVVESVSLALNFRMNCVTLVLASFPGPSEKLDKNQTSHVC